MSLKILFILPQSVIPPTDGGKQGIYYPLKYLANQNEIEVYAIIIAQLDEKILEEEYTNLGMKDVKFLFLDKKDKPFNLIKNIVKKMPYKWSKYVNKESKSQALKFAEAINPDVVICSAPHTLPYGLEIKKYLSIPLILREHNIEYDLVRQFYTITNNLIYKFIGRWQFLKTYKQEKYYWQLCDKVLFVSDSDYETASKEKPNLKHKFDILYDSFEVGKNIEILLDEREPYSFIIPVPIKSSLQNGYNLKWFINKIWKKFIDKNRNYKLYLTGSKNEDIKNFLNLDSHDLSRLNIINLGFVRDINRVISIKKYFISPTIFGSGIRLKVLHALSLRIPVFLTEIDYKTVNDFKDMENVILFKSAEEFENKLIQIENNQEIYKNISINGHKLICDNLNWNNYTDKLISIITKEVLV